MRVRQLVVALVLTGAVAYLTRSWTFTDALIVSGLAFIAGWLIVSYLPVRRRAWWRAPR